MLRKGSLHMRENAALDDGTYRAVTMMNAPPHGILVWAGRLHANAIAKESADIVATDYAVRETVSFCMWNHVWSYFCDREYAVLVKSLRESVRILYPGNDEGCARD